MLDSGLPKGDASVAHLATPQWQSFEMRMRARKAERCLQRAADALENGSISEARDAFDEARQLSPSDPRLQELEARLEALNQPAPQLPPRARGHAWTAAAAAAGLVLFGAMSWEAWVQREQLALLVPKAPPDMEASAGLANPTGAPSPADRRDVSPPTATQFARPTATQSDAPETSAAARGTPGTPSPDIVVQTTFVRPERLIEPTATTSDARASNEPGSVATMGSGAPNPKTDAIRALDTTEVPEATARPRPDAATPPAVAESRPPAAPSLPPATVPATNFIPSVVAPAEPARASNTAADASTTTVAPDAGATTSPPVNPPAPSPTPAAAAPLSPPPPVRDERLAIRAALSRYESAYNRLDATAVSSVWPSLDQRALARAFDSLTSQRVSLQNCNVDVKGSTARADCSGSASWTPKIGGGERTAARNWTFDLSQAEGAWRIVHVQAR